MSHATARSEGTSTDDDESPQFQGMMVDVRIVDTLPPPMCHEDDEGILRGERFLGEVDAADGNATPRACQVLVFCRLADGTSALLRVSNFCPCLYYELRGTSAIDIRNRLAHSLRAPLDAFKMRIVKRKKAYGWEPDNLTHPTGWKEHAFVEIGFSQVRLFRMAAKLASPVSHEGFIAPETKFFDVTNLTPSGWVCVKRLAPCANEDRVSMCDVEAHCDVKQLAPLAKDEIAPLRVCALDIECLAGQAGAFPDASKPDDLICMIGVIFWTFNQDAQRRIVYVLDETHAVDDTEIIVCESEADMLNCVRYDIIRNDPDVFVTYNGMGFDMPYMCKRAEMTGAREFLYMSRLVTQACATRLKKTSSAQKGANDLFLLDACGRTHLDLYQWVKDSIKLRSYKLNAVCTELLGQQKEDMDHRELPKLVRGDATGRAKVASYCIQDVELCIQLLKKKRPLEANVEMSRVTFTTLDSLSTRGQQFKVENQLCIHGHRLYRRSDGEGGFLLQTPDEFSGSPSDKYPGAYVLDPVTGFYRTPIAVLDFLSLYPSIMMMANLCFSTLIQNPSYASLPGVEVEVIEGHTWVRRVNGQKQTGLLPYLLNFLRVARADAKRQMKAVATKEEKSVLDARQLALKVSSNSVYGFTGAVNVGKYFCLAVAECVTSYSRRLLTETMQIMRDNYACVIVYGDTDSVMVHFSETTTPEEAFRVGDEASELATNHFARTYDTDRVVLEMEKVYYPYSLNGKKRYFGNMYEKIGGDVRMVKMDVKGMELVRRDNCELVQKMMRDVVDALLTHMEPERAFRAIHHHMTRLVDDAVPFSDFIVSKGLGRAYVNEEMQAHVRVCRRMRQRNPGSEPQIGDRVEFVYVVGDAGAIKAADKAEDPVYAREHNVPIDRLYYAVHQIERPVMSLLSHISTPMELFSKYITTLRLQQENQSTLVGFVTVADKGPSAPSDSGARMVESKHVQDVKKRRSKGSADAAQTSIMSFLK